MENATPSQTLEYGNLVPQIPHKSSRCLFPLTPHIPAIITTDFESLDTKTDADNETASLPILLTSPRSVRSSTSASASSHKSYLASLAVPSAEEHARIAEIQQSREDHARQLSRDERRRYRSNSSSIDATIAASLSRGRSASKSSFGSNGGNYVFGETIGALIAAATAVSTAPVTVPDTGSIAASSAPKEHRPSLVHRLGAALGTSLVLPRQNLEDFARGRAARVIQRNYRGYRTRRAMSGLYIDANTRWVHAIRELQYREATRPSQCLGSTEEDAESGCTAQSSTQSPETAARRYWKKATAVAKRASVDEDSEPDADSDTDSNSDAGSRKETPAAGSRMMALPYFLEMVDSRHRYGPNLRVYHEVWQRSSTQDSFFYWLDYGAGRTVDLGGAGTEAGTGCPRARLDREQVRYLSREERACYLVQVDDDGRLCWAKNGQPVDTTDGRWKDSVDGIVPLDDPTPAFTPARGWGGAGEDADKEGRDGDAAAVAESELEAAEAAKYAMDDSGSSKAQKRRVLPVPRLSATAVFNALLRKSIRQNTWIFVADTRFRLYVGLKEAGVFQHSSFLQGSRIAAAGLLQVRDGRLVSLSPLSGHYRPPAANFRAFVGSLREAGVADLERVRVSKAYVVLAGLELYTKTQQRRREWLRRGKGKDEKGERGTKRGT